MLGTIRASSGKTMSGRAVVAGLVEDLHDAPERDRWRVKVRGDLTTGQVRSERRMVWVRLDGQAAYDLAFAAHQAQRRIRARGTLSSGNRRVELVIARNCFEIVD